MSILNANIYEGPFKGWPLGVAMAISRGDLTVTRAKELMIEDLKSRITALQGEITAIEALPNEIKL